MLRVVRWHGIEQQPSVDVQVVNCELKLIRLNVGKFFIVSKEIGNLTSLNCVMNY